MVSIKLPMCMSNLLWQLVFYTSFKVSTCLVVLVFNIVMGHCCLCSIFIISQVCPYLVCLCVYLLVVISFLIINLRLWYKGVPNYLGESVTGLKFRLWKTWQGSCIAEENSQWGCWCRHRWFPVIPLHMGSAVTTEMGEQTILTSFGDVIIILLCLCIWG